MATHSSSQLPSSFYDTSINTTPNLSRDASVWAQSSSAATSNLHLHWCHICHNEQPSTTCYGYKRHMREQHEKPFYCMPLGSVEHTEDGPRCAFCGNPNPDPEHLSTHNVQLCESKPRTARRYARKHLLNNHLKHHNVIDGSALVEKWRGDIDMKKYHACGLCVSCFGSFTELVNHIDDKHWKFAEEISHWDRNKVIRGLLSRPEVNDCWRRILAEYPRSHESCFTWEPKIAKSLQSLLEMGEETVDALAARAFNQSDNYGMTGAGFAGPMRDTSQWMQTLQPPHGWPPLPSNLNQDFTAYTDAPPITTLTRHSQQQDRDYADPENSNGTGAFLSRSASQITSGAYGSSTSTARRHFGYLAQPPFSSSSRESIIRQQHPAYMLLTVSPSVTAQASETGTPHSSRHGTHLQDVSPIVVTNPRSRQVAEAGAYPARGHTGRSHPTSATQSTPLPLPYNCPTPSLGQVNSPSSPRNYRNAVAQHQDQGYVDDDDMVVDSELDESQHIIQDWDHSGS